MNEKKKIMNAERSGNQKEMIQNMEKNASEFFTEEERYVAQLLVELSNSEPRPLNLVSPTHDQLVIPQKKRRPNKRKNKYNDLNRKITEELTKSKGSLNELNNSSRSECKNPSLKFRLKMPSNPGNGSINPDNEKQKHPQTEMQMSNTQHMPNQNHKSRPSKKQKSECVDIVPGHETTSSQLFDEAKANRVLNKPIAAEERPDWVVLKYAYNSEGHRIPRLVRTPVNPSPHLSVF